MVTRKSCCSSVYGLMSLQLVVADREGTIRINMGSSILISHGLGIQMNLTS